MYFVLSRKIDKNFTHSVTENEVGVQLVGSSDRLRSSNSSRGNRYFVSEGQGVRRVGDRF